MKIKITKTEKEIEGTIEERKVTPFGTSGHIAVSKKHTGKYVDIVIPTEPNYFWILSDKELTEVVLVCKKLTKRNNGKLAHYKLEAISSITKTKFHFKDIYTVHEILKESKTHTHIAKKIKQSYNL